MPRFEINMQHSEESFTALAHMQYNLFCGRNRLARTVISALLICFGAANMDAWWGLLIIAYAGYLLTGRYSSANRTARKLAESIKAANMDFPRSRYIFEEKAMRVLSLPEEEELTPLAYSEVRGLGEDLTYFYIFRSEQGGYMVSKDALGDRYKEFRHFMEEKTGRRFMSRSTPFRSFQAWLRSRENGPEHL